jgi:hypothetical protein
MTVELIMQVSRGEGDRLIGTVRRGNDADARGFSGTLELVRVFEELVPADPGGNVGSSASRGAPPAVPESSKRDPAKARGSGEG